MEISASVSPTLGSKLSIIDRPSSFGAILATDPAANQIINVGPSYGQYRQGLLSLTATDLRFS
jgi:hypothetical protein